MDMDKIRRRRRKKPKPGLYSNSNSYTGSLSVNLSRQDEELEREVDTFLNWNASHIRKRQRRILYAGVLENSSTITATINTDVGQRDGNNKGKENNSLPVLLHLREIGTFRIGKHRGTSTKSWLSKVLHQPISTSAMPRRPIRPISTSQSQWNALQYSAPPYYGTYSDHNSFNGGVPSSHHTHQSGGHVDDVIKLQRYTWRPYTQQKIPFSKLRTPLSDA